MNSAQHLSPESPPEEVIAAYGDMVYRLAFAQTRNRADAEDIFQEVFLRYLQKAPRFAGEEHRKAWFLRVTLNCCKKLWASAFRRHTVPLEDTLSFRLPEENDLHWALQKLPPKYRTVIHLFYYEELPVKDIAALLRRKPATVRMQLTRAREQLRQLLEENNTGKDKEDLSC